MSARCADAAAVVVPSDVTPAQVGPSPLRRLSNREYLYALQDLFPEQQPELPALPKDGEVGGFENAAEGQTPSDVRVARYEAIANLYASGATADPDSVRALVDCDYQLPEQAELCAQRFIATVGRRIFRRPLEDSERERLTLRFRRWQSTLDFEAAVQLTLSALLQSPQFLYRAEVTTAAAMTGSLVPVEPYAMASRLAFFLWTSVPDEALLEAAAHGQLQTAEQVGEAAARMLDDPRAARALWDFHRQWLGLERILEDEHSVRTPEVDAHWTPRRQQAVQRESLLFVQNVLGSGGSLRDLLVSRRAWLNRDLRELYGLPAQADLTVDAFAEVMLPASERAGILTRAAFLAGYSHRGATSPPVRANAVRLRLLCRSPTPPPPGIDISPPMSPADGGVQTNRMMFDERTQGASCRGCHIGLNGIGFGFESFNAAGKHVLLDHGLPVDDHGELFGTDVDRPFVGAADLSQALSDSRDVHQCAVQQWLRYALGRAPGESEAALIETLTDRSLQEGASVRDLLVEVVTSPGFRYRQRGGT